MEDVNLQILRSLDKHDRLGDEGVFELLTTGRKDESGSFTEGCGLSNSRAAFLVAFLNVGKDNLIANRFWLMSKLEESETESGETQWDILLNMRVNEDNTWENYGRPNNIGWALDDLYKILVAKLEENPRGEYGNQRTLLELAELLK